MKLLSAILLIHAVLSSSSAVQNVSFFKAMSSFKECLSNKHPSVCVKEKALDALNNTIMSDEPMTFYDFIEIERNPKFRLNDSLEDDLPSEVSARSSKLSDILYEKIEEFFRSRTIKFNLDSAVEEGRYASDKIDSIDDSEDCEHETKSKRRGKKGGGGGKKGGMMMMGMIGVGCMMAQMMMGKIAFMAGAALILAKVALFLSAIMGFKKMSGGGGGGTESHVVYAAPAGGGDYGHSHGGGGGWHRSLDDEAQNLVYRAHTVDNTGYRK